MANGPPAQTKYRQRGSDTRLAQELGDSYACTVYIRPHDHLEIRNDPARDDHLADGLQCSGYSVVVYHCFNGCKVA